MLKTSWKLFATQFLYCFQLKNKKKKQSAANDIVSFEWIRSGRGLRKQENFKSWISFKKESYVVFNDY